MNHIVRKGTMPKYQPSANSVRQWERSTHPSNASRGFASTSASVPEFARSFGFRPFGLRDNRVQ